VGSRADGDLSGQVVCDRPAEGGPRCGGFNDSLLESSHLIDAFILRFDSGLVDEVICLLGAVPKLYKFWILRCLHRSCLPVWAKRSYYASPLPGRMAGGDAAAACSLSCGSPTTTPVADGCSSMGPGVTASGFGDGVAGSSREGPFGVVGTYLVRPSRGRSSLAAMDDLCSHPGCQHGGVSQCAECDQSFCTGHAAHPHEKLPG
jgi:hypothetical protein